MFRIRIRIRIRIRMDPPFLDHLDPDPDPGYLFGGLIKGFLEKIVKKKQNFLDFGKFF